jgi:tetratricopeptide (TPR) repeat protein
MSFVGKWYAFGDSPDFDAGVRAKERGDHEEAAACFRKAIANPPSPQLKDSAESYLADMLGAIGKASLSNGEWQAAIGTLDEALGLRPRFADVRLAKAEALILSDRVSEAAVEADFALEINPKYVRAMLIKAVLACLGSDLREADKWCKKALNASPPLSTDSSFLLGQDSLFAEKFSDAAGDLLQAGRPPIEAGPHQMVEGDALAKDSLWEQAASRYREALAEKPEYADIHCRLGQALLEMGELEQAEESFGEAIKINARFAEAIALLGLTLRRQEREDEAVALFREALEYNPHQPIAAEEIQRPRR